MTETTIFYSDSTSPDAYPGDVMKTGIAGKSTGDYDRVQYALWDDTTVWDAWVVWAMSSGYDSNNFTDFSSRAYRIVGRWETIGEGELSFMCIKHATAGALCVEAVITGDPPTSYASNTYSVASANVATLLDNWTEDRTLNDFGWSAPPTGVTLKAEDKDTPGNFKSFQVLNCEVTSVTMDCTNWAVKSDQTNNVGGYHYWEADTTVTFWWFDGRDLTAKKIDP